jgi:uncharacterized cofD-like protein
MAVVPPLDVRVVALGGGHGLAANLTALRRVVKELTAVVTVADNGGSSGRLREEFDCLPPGDLRQALAALCGDDEWGQTWAQVLQHRFRSEGELAGHAVGNLLIITLWELLGDHIEGLEWVGRLLGAQGRVLPMADVPLDITAEVIGADPARPQAHSIVRGQKEVALTQGQIVEINLEPAHPRACPEAVVAIQQADWVILGPGSWFSSVLPHLLVPALRGALETTSARRLVTLNIAPQPDETEGFSPETHLQVLAEHAPDLTLDIVLVDSSAVVDLDQLRETAGTFGAAVHVADLAADDGSPRHDPEKLSRAYAQLLARA